MPQENEDIILHICIFFQVESLRLDKNVNASSSGQDSAASATPTPKESESPGGAAQGAEGNGKFRHKTGRLRQRLDLKTRMKED